MEKFIAKDKLLELVAKLWDAGVTVELRPDKKEICVTRKHGDYVFLPVYSEASSDEIVESILRKENCNARD